MFFSSGMTCSILPIGIPDGYSPRPDVRHGTKVRDVGGGEKMLINIFLSYNFLNTAHRMNLEYVSINLKIVVFLLL